MTHYLVLVDAPIQFDNFSHDAVIVVTNPAGIAGWVSLDLPSRVERHVSEPVITVEVDPTGTD